MSSMHSALNCIVFFTIGLKGMVVDLRKRISGSAVPLSGSFQQRRVA